MTRPDGVVVFAALVVSGALLDGRWWVRTRAGRRALLGSALPFVAILLPYEAWRVTYYGALLPNTYYAKAAYLTYWSRGFYYLRTYVLIYILWPFVPVALVGAGMAPRGPARRFLVSAILAIGPITRLSPRLWRRLHGWRFLTPVSGVFTRRWSSGRPDRHALAR
jgi:hypothetical protein